MLQSSRRVRGCRVGGGYGLVGYEIVGGYIIVGG